MWRNRTETCFEGWVRDGLMGGAVLAAIASLELQSRLQTVEPTCGHGETTKGSSFLINTAAKGNGNQVCLFFFVPWLPALILPGNKDSLDRRCLLFDSSNAR